MIPLGGEKRPRVIYRIVDTFPPDAEHPYTLLSDNGTSLRIDSSLHHLRDHAFDCGADEVSHDYLTVPRGGL